jgi:hypothetical protein
LRIPGVPFAFVTGGDAGRVEGVHGVVRAREERKLQRGCGRLPLTEAEGAELDVLVVIGQLEPERREHRLVKRLDASRSRA